MLQTDDLRVFARVAEQGSLTRGAALAGRPKSTASRQIMRLERQAGGPLFERSVRQLRLTDAGRLLYEHARRVLDALAAAEAAMDLAQGAPRGVLRINVPLLFAAKFLTARLPGFMELHPELQVVLDISSHPAGAAVAEVDVAVRVGPIESSSLIARKLGTSELRLYASPSCLAGAARAVIEAEMMRHDATGEAERGCFRDVLAFLGGLPQRRIEVVDPLVRHGLIVAGAGVAWLPAFLCRDDVAAGRLVNLLPQLLRGQVEIHALFTVHGGATPKVRAFTDFLASAMGPLTRR